VYNTAGEEVLAEARRRGLRAVVEQTIAPFAYERRLLAEERARFPRWEPDPGEGPELDAYAQRERREWALADRVLCGSSFVRDAIAGEGGPGHKCVVVPYGVGGGYRLPPRPAHGGPLRVLTVGAVGLRKGTPYAIEAARRMRGRAAFRWVGPFKMAPQARAELGPDVEFTGGVPRPDVVAHYAWADVFLLPSLCEGSATATYEALTAGLPVVCTPNTGSVVRDGVEGFIVAPRDAEAIVGRLDELAADAPRRGAMAESARSRAAELDYDTYARALLAALDRAGAGVSG
jgi:glycosyltransferase involved in cell wall biosynthesis